MRAHSAKVQVQTHIQFALWLFTAKTHSAFSVNVDTNATLIIMIVFSYGNVRLNELYVIPVFI